MTLFDDRPNAGPYAGPDQTEEDPFALTPEEIAAMQTETTPAQPTNGHSSHQDQQQAAAQQVARSLAMLMNTATPALDEDAVREIVKQEAGAMSDELRAALAEAVSSALASQAPRRVVIEVGEYTSPEQDGPLPVNFYRIVKLLNARQNTLLVGPAGSGKTHSARLAAEALGLRFASLSVTAGMSEGALMGRILPTGEGGKFEYARSQFVDFYENGGCFLLDEIDAADPNTLLVINTALANGHMPIPSRIEKPEAKRHPDFVCIAAANTFGSGADRQYVGREQLDASTLDRFLAGTVTCDYDALIEEALIDANLLTWGRAMRERIGATSLRRFVSTRFLLDATKLLATGMASREAIMDSFFAGWKPDERAKVGALAPAKPYDILAEVAARTKKED